MAVGSERVVFTDGACRGNPGPGGWAWALGTADYASGFGGETTNQRMELTAAWRAVEALGGPLEVRSDSTYVVNCFNQQWHVGWRKRGWRNSQKQSVANRDLWEPFIDLVLGRGDVRFTWVKGHAGTAMNEFVDQLAVAAAAGTPTCAGLGSMIETRAATEPSAASTDAASPAAFSEIGGEEQASLF